MSHIGGPIQSVLFVCTGNIFRSLTAEYAFNAMRGTKRLCAASSAGIRVQAQDAHEWVRTKLHIKGVNILNHVPRQLNREMVETADLVIAMSLNHQAYIREQFAREAPLFNQVCFDQGEPIPDVHEVLPEWEKNLEAARSYVWSVIDRIWEAMPYLISRIELLG